MSRRDGLRKLSAAYTRVYQFKCAGIEVQDYLIKREVDERTKECYYTACYAYMRSSYLFLFSHDMARSCSQAVNLQRCVVRAFQPDKHWPSCCSGGFQVWPPGSGYTEAAASGASEGLPDTCWQLGCFSGSKLRRTLEGFTKRGSSASAAAAAAAAAEDDGGGEYYNNEADDCDSEDPELCELWAFLAGLDDSQLASSSGQQQQQQQQQQTVASAQSVASLEDTNGSSGGGGGSSWSIGATSSGRAAAPAGPSAQPPVKSPKPQKPPPTNVNAGYGGGAVGRGQRPSYLQQQQPTPPTCLLDAVTSAGSVPMLQPPLTPASSQSKTGSLAANRTGRSPPQPPQRASQTQLLGLNDPKLTVPVPPSGTPVSPGEPPVPSRDPPLPSRDSPLASRDPPIPSRDPPIPSRDPPIPSRDPPIPSRDPPIPSRDPPIPSRYPPIPSRDPVPPAPSSSTTPPQSTQLPADLYEILIGARSIDALCGYYCYGYYGLEGMNQARQLMKRVTDEGAYMLRGFCNRQAGQEKALCIKYNTVYRLRVQVSNGYRINNDLNEQVHSSMGALLFYHHIHPIKVGQQIEHQLILRRPYDFDGKLSTSTDYRTFPFTAALWNHGTKEQCAETLKNSEEGTYAVRADLETASLVLCVMHRNQIVKFRINVNKSDSGREFVFPHGNGLPKFRSLEELLAYYHKQPIRGSTGDGEVTLRMPFQLVKRCQEELDFQQLTLESVFTSDSMEAAKMKVGRLKSGNFLLHRGQPSAAEEAATGSGGGNGGSVRAVHSLIVREDTGGCFDVRVFRITERDTDLSFKPKSIFILEDKPELVTDRIEKMINFLCITTRYLSPDIMCLVKP